MTDYDRLSLYGLVYDGSANTKYEFKKMCRLFGKAYLDYLVASYAVKLDMSDQEWADINGQVPLNFIRQRIAPEATNITLE